MKKANLDIREKLKLIAAEVLGWRLLNDDEQRGALAFARDSGTWMGREQDKPEFWWTEIDTLERLPQVSLWLSQQILNWAARQSDGCITVDVGNTFNKLLFELRTKKPTQSEIYTHQCEPEDFDLGLIDVVVAWLSWRKQQEK